MKGKDIKFDQVHFSSAVKERMFHVMHCRKARIGLREFAKEIGISSSTLSRVENGKPPDIETFFKLCWWMNRKCDEFYSHK